MPLLRLLSAMGLRVGDDAPASTDPLLARLQTELGRLGGERLEYLAAFAAQLARVANAEDGISAAEVEAMAAQLAARGGLAPADAALIVALLEREYGALRGAPAYLLTRAINDGATPEEKQALLDCLYAVAAADHLVSDVEEQEIRRIADGILVPHRVLMEIRARYRDRLEALQRPRDTNT